MKQFGFFLLHHFIFDGSNFPEWGNEERRLTNYHHGGNCSASSSKGSYRGSDNFDFMI